MGRDKANIPWGPDRLPLWQIQLEKLAALDPAEVLISARPGQQFEGQTLVVDEQPGAGPLPALALCLSAAANDHVLPLAVDMPAMSSTFLQQLLRDSTECGLVYRTGKFFEPFPALYPRALLPLLRETLTAGQDSMQQFIARAATAGVLATAELPPGAAPLFKSLNTPEDLDSGEKNSDN